MVAKAKALNCLNLEQLRCVVSILSHNQHQLWCHNFPTYFSAETILKTSLFSFFESFSEFRISDVGI